MNEHTADARPVQTASAAYIDTVEVWFQGRITPDEYRRVLQFGRIKPSRAEDGRMHGYRLILNQPTKQAILAVDRIARKHGGVLSRFDLAVDAQMMDVESAECLRTQIQNQAILKWRRDGPMVEIEETTTYWSKLNEGKRRSSRNLVLYADKPNRHTGEVDGCVHIELRFLSPRVIRCQGINVRDLIDIKPSQLFNEHVKWSDVASRYLKRIMRKEVNKDRAYYRGRTTVHPLIDQYRSNIPRRTSWLLKRLGFDRAQNVKGLVKAVNVKPTDPAINIPSALTWPSPSSLGSQLPCGGDIEIVE